MCFVVGGGGFGRLWPLVETSPACHNSKIQVAFIFFFVCVITDIQTSGRLKARGLSIRQIDESVTNVVIFLKVGGGYIKQEHAQD